MVLREVKATTETPQKDFRGIFLKSGVSVLVVGRVGMNPVILYIYINIYINISVEEFHISCFLFFQYATTWVTEEMLLHRVWKRNRRRVVFFALKHNLSSV